MHLKFIYIFVSNIKQLIKMKTHWKKLNNPDYIGAYELMVGDDPIELTVEIVSVTNETVTGLNNRRDECIVARLKGQKPMILNATNAKMIAKIADSPYIEDWAGVKITLYVAKVKAFGETVDALRVKSKTTLQQDMSPKHPKWKGAVKALKNGSTTIEAIKQVYNLTEANEKLMIKEGGVK